MKRISVSFLVGVFALSVMAGVALAADKFAYVDMAKLFGEYDKTNTYDKALTDKKEAFQTEIDKKLAEIKQAQDKINLLSEKEKEAKRGEFENKKKALEDYVRQKQIDLRKEQDEKLNEIYRDITAAVKQCAEKDGYTLVFNSGILLYQSEGLNITNQVLGVLNKGTAKGGKR